MSLFEAPVNENDSTQIMMTSLSKSIKTANSEQKNYFFIDWDDSILPTTGLRAAGLLAGTIAEMTEESAPPCIPSGIHALLSELEDLAVSVIEIAESLGKVVFVTNSSSMWIPFTVKRFFPRRLYQMISKFECYSARPEEVERALANPETAKNVFYVPTMGTQWKIDKFKQLASRGSFNHFISIGDGYAERCAVMALRNDNLCSKAVRLDAQPSIELMLDQLLALKNLLKDIVADPRSGDVALFNDGFRLIPTSDENLPNLVVLKAPN